MKKVSTSSFIFPLVHWEVQILNVSRLWAEYARSSGNSRQVGLDLDLLWEFSPFIAHIAGKSMSGAKQVVFFSWQKADQQIFILQYFQWQEYQHFITRKKLNFLNIWKRRACKFFTSIHHLEKQGFTVRPDNV